MQWIFKHKSVFLSLLCLTLLFVALELPAVMSESMAGELPLEVSVTRYLIEIDTALDEKKPAEALKIFEEKLLPLRGKVTFPAEIDYRYAVALHMAGRNDKAAEALEAYLMNPALDKGNLQAAVKLQIAIEKVQAEKNKPASLTLDCGNGVKMEFAKIPAGTFMMGSPMKEYDRSKDEVLHQVTLSKVFYMGIHEVTQAQYRAVMGSNPSKLFKGDNLPVNQVSWYDAVDFCQRLSEKTGRKVRLPTEAEWEYACRAGTTTPFNTGGSLVDKANYRATATYYSDDRKGVYIEKTVAVGSFPANRWGLYDMHGNVNEWCSDWDGDYPSGDVTDPKGPGDGEYRVSRGGSWSNRPSTCRSAIRFGNAPGISFDGVGFRVALD